MSLFYFFFFFFNDTATTEIYTLSLHDALPISRCPPPRTGGHVRTARAAPPARLRHHHRRAPGRRPLRSPRDPPGPNDRIWGQHRHQAVLPRQRLGPSQDPAPVDERPAGCLGGGGRRKLHHSHRPWPRPAPGGALHPAHSPSPHLHRRRLRPRLLGRPGGPRRADARKRAGYIAAALPRPGARPHGPRPGLRASGETTHPLPAHQRRLPPRALSRVAGPALDRHPGEGRATL